MFSLSDFLRSNPNVKLIFHNESRTTLAPGVTVQFIIGPPQYKNYWSSELLPLINEEEIPTLLKKFKEEHTWDRAPIREESEVKWTIKL